MPEPHPPPTAASAANSRRRNRRILAGASTATAAGGMRRRRGRSRGGRRRGPVVAVGFGAVPGPPEVRCIHRPRSDSVAALAETTLGREPAKEGNRGAARERSLRKVVREEGREEEEVRAARPRLLLLFLLRLLLMLMLMLYCMAIGDSL